MAQHDSSACQRLVVELLTEANPAGGGAGFMLGMTQNEWAQLDMLGQFAWESISDHLSKNFRTTEVGKLQKKILASIIGAYVVAKTEGRMDVGSEVLASAFFSLIENMDLPNGLDGFDDLMGWQ